MYSYIAYHQCLEVSLTQMIVCEGKSYLILFFFFSPHVIQVKNLADCICILLCFGLFGL